MDTSGQAAEQIVKYSMEGMEYTLKVAGRGTERLAAILLALAKDQQKTKGKTTLNALLKSGKELTVFTIPEGRLKEFAKETRRYGVLYCALREKQSGGLTDILVRAEDAAKLNRIVERLGLNQVEPVPVEQNGIDSAEQELQTANKLLQQILTPPEQERPTSARMEALSPSGHGSVPSVPSSMLTPNQRPSVRAALKRLRQEQQENPLMNLNRDGLSIETQTIIEKKGAER